MHPAENSGNWDFRSRKDEKCDGRARFVTHFRYEHLRERFKAYIKYFLFKICDCRKISDFFSTDKRQSSNSIETVLNRYLTYSLQILYTHVCLIITIFYNNLTLFLI